MATPVRTVITGVTGRMGQMLVKLVRDTDGFVLSGGTEKAGHASVGLDVGLACHLGPLEVPVVASIDEALERADVVIDFTTPEASVQHARACAKRSVGLVVGSTGFSADAKAEIAEVAKAIPIVMSPNMSIGVNLVIEVAAQLAARLGNDFDIDVLEAHHRHKKDAPSGTALRLADEIAKALSRRPEDVRPSRVGVTGERRREEIGVQTLRGGDVVGEHTVYFFGDGERIELTHRATSREQFGRGALRAARWVTGRAPGLYGMGDVLGR
ncbi:MAG: 4-hydroxy-tetrahydrodipicolinate reductase [Myxococcaceae bacterium]|nr:4-hydroxy-tetrahydrodipicolinate reductase [Myxococcaceae bacterium]